MSAAFIDANIPMYASGGPHSLREPARRVLLALGAGDMEAITDTEILQEILYRYLSQGRRTFGFAVFDEFRSLMTGRILAVDEPTMVSARRLAELHPRLSPRDLIHVAVMQAHGIGSIVTADRDFDGIPGIQRLDLASF